jgi:hypothetical protein
MRKSHWWRRGSPSQEKKLGGPRPISFEITHTRACAIDLGMVARSPPTSPTSSDAGFRGRAGTDLVLDWRRAAPWPPCFLAGVQQENRDEGLRARGGCGYGKEVEEWVSPAGGWWKSSTQRPRSVGDFSGDGNRVGKGGSVREGSIRLRLLGFPSVKYLYGWDLL